ncbi:dsDNA nuclease domain-containing protein [Alkalihalobacillus sp. FSL W8-0930]
MDIGKEIDQTIKKNLESKLTIYLTEIGEASTFSQKDKNDFIEEILSGKVLDFSGVTAMRGFVYQYYVAINYLIDMISKEDAWWDRVILELLDDVALCSKEKLRFVQVKTKRETDIETKLTLGDLHSRVKQKGSWLDKLFLLNTQVLKSDNGEIIKDGSHYSKYELEFELATNTPYHKDVAVYEKDDKYFSEVDKESYKKLEEKINCSNLQWEIEHGLKTFKFTNKSYMENSRSINWYLDSFRVKRHGSMSALKTSVIDKITSHTNGYKDEYHKYKSTLIFNMILNEIIEKTCRDDSGVSEGDFVLDKSEFENLFAGFIERANAQAIEQNKSNNLQNLFDECFKKIHQDFNSNNWNSRIEQELLITLDEVEKYFLENIMNDDLFIYQRFLNRFYYIKNSYNQVPLNEFDDKVSIKNALKVFIYILTYFKHKDFTPKAAELLFFKGTDKEGKDKVFTAYNVNNKSDLELSIKFVRSSAQRCTISQEFNHDYYCLMTNVKEEEFKRPPKKDSVNKTIIDLDSPGHDNEMKKPFDPKDITEVLENIKFLSLDKMNRYFDSLNKELEDEISLQSDYEFWSETILFNLVDEWLKGE